MDNILANNDFLEDFNPKTLATIIAGQLKERRLEMNWSQKELATRSGVSLGSLKRFEHGAEISLKHLIQLAIVLGVSDEFKTLFVKRQYASIDEIIKTKQVKVRKRGRSHD